MKKKILFMSCVGLSLIMASCQKESLTSANQPKNTKQNESAVNMRMASSELADKVIVSPHGFLVLDSAGLIAYSDFIYDNSVSDILDFHQSIGFTSQVAVEDHADNALPSSSENGEYMFNSDGVLQIGGIVIRGVNDDGYLLAMPAENLNEESYLKLASKDFDSNIMAKLSTNSDYSPNLESYVRENIGHDGTVNPPPPPVQAKFWGWGDWHRTGGVACHRHYYIFWIHVGNEYGYCP